MEWVSAVGAVDFGGKNQENLGLHRCKERRTGHLSRAIDFPEGDANANNRNAEVGQQRPQAQRIQGTGVCVCGKVDLTSGTSKPLAAISVDTRRRVLPSRNNDIASACQATTRRFNEFAAAAAAVERESQDKEHTQTSRAVLKKMYLCSVMISAARISCHAHTCPVQGPTRLNVCYTAFYTAATTPDAPTERCVSPRRSTSARNKISH